MKNRIIAIFLILSAPVWLFAQETSTPEVKTFGIGVVPQYAISSGSRIDLDFRLRKPGRWLVVAPQFYMNNGNSLNWDLDEMFGLGIELQHKIFFRDTPQPKGAYMAYGPVFQYFSIKDQGLQAYNFQEGGVDYIGLDEGMMQTNIYKFGGNLIFGMQTVISDYFYMDIYIGTGIRLSIDDRTTGLHGYYNNGWIDFGYSGTLLVGGIRFGISL